MNRVKTEKRGGKHTKQTNKQNTKQNKTKQNRNKQIKKERAQTNKHTHRQMKSC